MTQTQEPTTKPQIKISVVMPAYNCATLIGDTIHSLLNQTLKEYEIIVINDGSTDNTLDVLEEFKEKDERLQIYTVENGGPAKARNLGIEKAKGEYIYFMDSDDLIDSNMLLEMYSLAHENDLEICACGYTMENISTKTPHIKEFLFHDFIASNKETFREELMPLIKSHLMYVVWNKLFKTELLSKYNIRFTDYFSGEDRLFNIHTFEHIKSFGFINKPFYRYFLRGQASLANRYVVNRFDAAVKAHESLISAYQHMELYDKNNQAYIDFIFIKGVMASIAQLNSKGCKLSFQEKKQVIETILNHPLVQNALSSNDKDISYSKRINQILKTRNKTLIYLTGKAIFILQFKLNALYLNIKHKLK